MTKVAQNAAQVKESAAQRAAKQSAQIHAQVKGELEVPDGLDQAVKASVFAAAISMSVSKVEGWIKRGYVPTLFVGKGSNHYIPTTELARFEREGWRVDWDLVAAETLKTENA